VDGLHEDARGRGVVLDVVVEDEDCAEGGFEDEEGEGPQTAVRAGWRRGVARKVKAMRARSRRVQMPEVERWMNSMTVARRGW